jgi:hypothetical protein
MNRWMAEGGDYFEVRQIYGTKVQYRELPRLFSFAPLLMKRTKPNGNQFRTKLAIEFRETITSQNGKANFMVYHKT